MKEFRGLITAAQARLRANDMNGARQFADMVLQSRGIRVAAAWEGVDEEAKPRCLAALRDAVAAWKRQLPELTIEVVQDPAKANWTIQFQPSVQCRGVQVAGITKWRSMSEGTIEIRTVLGRPYPQAHMCATITHELGHVLGLADHDDTDHLMGPISLAKRPAALGQHELNPLRALRE